MTTTVETDQLPDLAPNFELTFQKATVGSHTATGEDGRWYSATKMPTGWEVRQYEDGTDEPIQTHRENSKAECIVSANYWEAIAREDIESRMYYCDVYGDL